MRSLCISLAVDHQAVAVPKADLVTLRSFELVGLTIAEKWEKGATADSNSMENSPQRVKPVCMHEAQRHEAEQDAADGLLCSELCYHDHRRRFGPDWQLGD